MFLATSTSSVGCLTLEFGEEVPLGEWELDRGVPGFEVLFLTFTMRSWKVPEGEFEEDLLLLGLF
jgi:hypothetical protein